MMSEAVSQKSVISQVVVSVLVGIGVGTMFLAAWLSLVSSSDDVQQVISSQNTAFAAMVFIILATFLTALAVENVAVLVPASVLVLLGAVLVSVLFESVSLLFLLVTYCVSCYWAAFAMDNKKISPPWAGYMSCVVTLSLGIFLLYSPVMDYVSYRTMDELRPLAAQIVQDDDVCRVPVETPQQGEFLTRHLRYEPTMLWGEEVAAALTVPVKDIYKITPAGETDESVYMLEWKKPLEKRFDLIGVNYDLVVFSYDKKEKVIPPTATPCAPLAQ